jgi:glycosyltransferase involved in cell wall biosynthesis
MRIAVIVAAYNEQRHISEVVRGIIAAGQRWVVVVDDGSKDQTAELASKAGATVLHHLINCGKGAAMKTGADYAVLNGADAIIFIDGDGQHDPIELKDFARELRTGRQIVFGYRRQTRSMPWARRLGKWMLTHAVRWLYGMRLHDILCGYRALTSQAYKQVLWHSSRYGVESEMVALAGKKRLTYSEIPIKTIYHDRYKGVTAVDGVRILWNLCWWRVFR